MSKLGPELIVKIVSSDLSSKRFSTYVENPFIDQMFKLLNKPICTSITADDSIIFNIRMTDGGLFTANAFAFDFGFNTKYLVLGGDMKRVVSIPSYLYKALDVYEHIGTNLAFSAIEYLPYENVAKCAFNERKVTTEMGSTEGFWKFVKSLDNIRKGYVSDFLENGAYKEEVLL